MDEISALKKKYRTQGVAQKLEKIILESLFVRCAIEIFIPASD